MTYRRNKSLLRAFTILEALNVADRGLSATELALRTGISIATTHRFLSNMVDLGYVTRDPDQKRYSIGFGLTLFGNKRLIVDRLVKRARRPLLALSRQSGYIGSVEGPQAIIENGVVPARMLKVARPNGAHFDAHAHSLGKALIALLPRPEVEAMYGSQTLRAHTANTITRLSSLLRSLDDIRKQGYAVDDGELTGGVRSVATALINPKGRAMCAIAVEGFKHELGVETIEALVSLLKRTGHKIMREVVEQPGVICASQVPLGIRSASLGCNR